MSMTGGMPLPLRLAAEEAERLKTRITIALGVAGYEILDGKTWEIETRAPATKGQHARRILIQWNDLSPPETIGSTAGVRGRPEIDEYWLVYEDVPQEVGRQHGATRVWSIAELEKHLGQLDSGDIVVRASPGVVAATGAAGRLAPIIIRVRNALEGAGYNLKTQMKVGLPWHFLATRPSDDRSFAIRVTTTQRMRTDSQLVNLAEQSPPSVDEVWVVYPTAKPLFDQSKIRNVRAWTIDELELHLGYEPNPKKERKLTQFEIITSIRANHRSILIASGGLRLEIDERIAPLQGTNDADKMAVRDELQKLRERVDDLEAAVRQFLEDNSKVGQVQKAASAISKAAGKWLTKHEPTISNYGLWLVAAGIATWVIGGTPDTSLMTATGIAAGKAVLDKAKDKS